MGSFLTVVVDRVPDGRSVVQPPSACGACGHRLTALDLVPEAVGGFPVVVKLALLPALLGTTAWAFGVRGPELVYLVLCGAVPTAMNGYMLARQLGGDAEFYAAAATLQTALAVLSMPVVLALAAQLSSG